MVLQISRGALCKASECLVHLKPTQNKTEDKNQTKKTWLEEGWGACLQASAWPGGHRACLLGRSAGPRCPRIGKGWRCAVLSALSAPAPARPTWDRQQAQEQQGQGQVADPHGCGLPARTLPGRRAPGPYKGSRAAGRASRSCNSCHVTVMTHDVAPGASCQCLSPRRPHPLSRRLVANLKGEAKSGTSLGLCDAPGPRALVQGWLPSG